jgi:Uri superfamily endonuclease
MRGSAKPDRLPSRGGTYILLIHVCPEVDLTAGRLGRIILADGCYAYVGSAQGAGGLAARISRHLAPVKRLHWHIDALTSAAPVVSIWYVAGDDRLECRWAQILAGHPGVEAPAPGFGSSDCKCRTHLFRLLLPEMEPLYQALGKPQRLLLPGSVPVEQRNQNETQPQRCDLLAREADQNLVH